MVEFRKGDYTETYSGIKFYILDPKYEEIDINDIAHALSMICRFNGHCSQFYSVAQHSVLAAIEAFKKGYDLTIQFAALMHDASEAYICDIPRPIKPEFNNYKQIEENLMKCIFDKFNISISYNDPKIKEIDNDLVTNEAFFLMKSKGNEWKTKTNNIIKIKEFWNPGKAEKQFIFMAKWLMQEIKKKGEDYS
jgi:5'-deoxynucleotidase YfbR-like HD superfamily hydrolase